MRKAVVLLIVLAGCASSADNLQRVSAMLVGNGVPPERIDISNVQRGMTDVRWTATVPSGGIFLCSADDMVRHPSCVRH